MVSHNITFDMGAFSNLVIDFPDNTGAMKIMIEIKDLIPNFAEQLEIKCDLDFEESDNALRESYNALRVSE